jgi:hypothetical protein
MAESWVWMIDSFPVACVFILEENKHHDRDANNKGAQWLQLRSEEVGSGGVDRLNIATLLTIMSASPTEPT